jgi:hypothetical protein
MLSPETGKVKSLWDTQIRIRVILEPGLRIRIVRIHYKGRDPDPAFPNMFGA